MSTKPRPQFYIGIDPDVSKSGFAIWDKQTFQLLTCLSLPNLMQQLKAYHLNVHIHVRLEAGWLIKCNNWHGGGNRSANAVGRNHEIGRQIEKFMKDEDISYELVKPQGYSSYNHNVFCAITNWPRNKKTNGDSRVAGMLVYGF